MARTRPAGAVPAPRASGSSPLSAIWEPARSPRRAARAGANAEDILHDSGDEGLMPQLDIVRVPPCSPRPAISAATVLGIRPESTPPPERNR
ncbi:hypothetical protein CDG81_11555 [Actinopolyspora erythraea]|uniref:Uncharacterized protein n=1 Tax=Actinopolyspora erythraea TaxID=414996 RepID=A0A099D5L6_9ACTN|nr:hypothetical protein [Actinopolyspora erythraea]ASU78806.1 hypothetical protein CDG81_11555 [Actinopolyspora erythraea]KGI81324.1 hypothetical protein IL38_11635 [Actinopolyspora erythraea]